ncbi:hypothetical protein M378DRAFT_1062612 [Amanita muscaria Koide BX008]|uniref:Uncharacterized protein n=1 Tax=Amanita muscaria (strain Koide BX008) TaxID=946122 RepID=A0A0C2WW86_AMAMK|nr:hypothetical protein M378DRAFT_1062612 [Amanita muscaria Koide BX008]
MKSGWLLSLAVTLFSCSFFICCSVSVMQMSLLPTLLAVIKFLATGLSALGP